ncbi:MAG: MDR family MFS transporter [Ilumatobacteraceae bacterium]
MNRSAEPFRPPNDSPAVTQQQLNLAVVGLILGLFLAGLDSSIVAVAMPTIAGKLGGFGQLAWVSTAYIVTTAMATPLLGKLSDIFGRRRLYLMSVVVFLIGSVLCGVAQNMGQLIAFRALQGIGGGGIGAITFAIIAELVVPRERGKYIGLFTSAYALSSVAGPLIGGWIVEETSWRWIFLVNIPIGGVALFITASVLHMEFHRIEAKVDIRGAVLLSLAILGLFAALEFGREWGWTSIRLFSVVATTALVLFVFVREERKAAEPMVPMRLLRDRVVFICSTIGFLVGTAMFGVTLYFSVFFQDVRFISPTVSGLMSLPIIIGILISSTIIGRLISHTGKYRIFPIIGTFVMILGIALAAQSISPSATYTFIAVAMGLIGLGIGATFPTLSIASQNAVGIRDLGITTALITFFRTLGGAVALALYSTVFNSVVIDRLKERLPSGSGFSGNLSSIIGTPAAIENADPVIRQAIVNSITDGIVVVFLIAIPIALVAFILSFLMEERTLRQTGALTQRVEVG